MPEEYLASVIRVLLVDDHEVVRHGVTSILEAQAGFSLVGQAANLNEAIELLKVHQPDVCLVDLRLRGESGVTFIEHVSKTFPRIRCIVLTMFDSDEDILRAFRAGARAYLLKDSFGTEIAAAIRDVVRGQKVVPKDIQQRLRGLEMQKQLSAREREILAMVALGESNKSIAAALHISEATVKTHLVRTFEKLDAPDRASAVATAISRGILVQ